MALAQNAAKAWVAAAGYWADRPPVAPIERALAAEAYVGLGRAAEARRLVAGLTLPGIGGAWLAELLVTLASVEDLQAALGSGEHRSQQAALLAARRYDELEALLAADPGLNEEQVTVLADVLYRKGAFAEAAALAADALAGGRVTGQARVAKLERMQINCQKRLESDFSGAGRRAWADRHPLVARLAALLGIADLGDDDLALLLQLTRFLRSGDLLRDAVADAGYFSRRRLEALFAEETFGAADLRQLLGSIGARSARENAEIAAALLSRERLMMVPDVYAE